MNGTPSRPGLRPVAAALLALAAAPHAATAFCAESYPNRPLRLIVPYTPSGPTDILARIVGEQLAAAWGQPVVVENRPGAAGMIGTELAARAAPDGYTLCTAGLTFSTAAALRPDLAFSPARDFAPVALMASAANVLAAHPSVPAKSVTELVALARARPGELLYPTGGVGGGQWLAGALFARLAQAKMTPVQYRGSAPGLQALLAGEVSVGFSDLIITRPHVEAGRLRALGVTSPRRSAVAPDLPTIAEAGLPGFAMTAWFGLVAPARTPTAIVDKLNAAVRRGLASPAVQRRIANLGAEPADLTPAEFERFIAEETRKWSEVIAAARPAAK